jgi:hypothetical protein
VRFGCKVDDRIDGFFRQNRIDQRRSQIFVDEAMLLRIGEIFEIFQPAA